MNVLISAFALCGPNYKGKRHPGSEYIIAWNFVVGLAKKVQGNVTVLVGCSDGTFSIGEFDNLKCNNLPSNVRVVPVSPSDATMWWFSLFKRFGSWVWPLVLRSWNKDAYAMAMNLHGAQKFDVVHQYGPGGFKNPGLLYRLENTRSVWGPIYGWHFFSLRHAFSQSVYVGLRCIAWNVFNWASTLDPSLSQAARRFNSLIYGTPEAKMRFEAKFNRHGIVVPEQGIDGAVSVQAKEQERVKIIWVGSLDYRKNISLFLKIIERLDLNRIQVTIAGSGPDEWLITEKYKHLVAQPHINFVGAIPRDKLLSMFPGTDSIVFTTLAEGNTSVLFEALKYGVIPIAPDTHGFSNTVRAVGGELINMSQSPPAVQSDFVHAIEKLESIDLGRKRAEVGATASKFCLSSIIDIHLRNYENII